MISMDKIRKEYGGYICRRCLNEIYHTNLTPRDCIYETIYLRECKRCHKSGHTVEGLNKKGMLKTLLK